MQPGYTIQYLLVQFLDDNKVKFCTFYTVKSDNPARNDALLQIIINLAKRDFSGISGLF